VPFLLSSVRNIEGGDGLAPVLPLVKEGV